MRNALGFTLGQCRHVGGTIEKNEYGNFSMVTRPNSTVLLLIHWLDNPVDQYSLYCNLNSAHSCYVTLGDPANLTFQGMTMASEASPSISPVVAGF